MDFGVSFLKRDCGKILTIKRPPQLQPSLPCIIQCDGLAQIEIHKVLASVATYPLIFFDDLRVSVSCASCTVGRLTSGHCDAVLPTFQKK